ncbi:hypothetical protein AB0B20_25515 [Micromonospora sp. NPDC049151]|uniref:hypothetical protein n=1 Tax=Micromonospora sp. NPDC049151 TaxID=3155648 RepID=UPI003400ED60
MAKVRQESEDDGAGIPYGRLAAIDTVRNVAVERVGGRPGFDCLLGFLAWEQVGLADPGFVWSLFLEPAELAQQFAARYELAVNRFHLIEILLVRAQQMRDQEAVKLAGRIMQRMQKIRADGGNTRPLLYLGTNDEGIAAAIAIYDDFWTERWGAWVDPSFSQSE